MADTDFNGPALNQLPMPAQGVRQQLPGREDTAASTMPLIQVENADQTMSRMKAEDQARETANQDFQANPVVVALANYIDTCRRRAADARRTSGVEERLIDAMRRRKGEYEPARVAEFKRVGQLPIWMGLTEVKCLALEARLAEAYSSDDGRPPFTIAPTPKPDLGEDVIAQIVKETEARAAQDIQAGAAPMTQAELWQFSKRYAEEMRAAMLAQIDAQAKEAAGAMQDKIDDQLEEGGFEDCMTVFRSMLITYGTAIVEGPVLRRTRVMVGFDAQGGAPVMIDRIVMAFDVVNPLDFYPAPYAQDCNDGYNVTRVRFSRQGLSSIKGTSGVIDAAVDTVLNLYGMQGLRTEQTADMQRRSLQDQQTAFSEDDTIEGWVFRGCVQGRMLIEADPRMLMAGVKPLQDYDIKAVMVGTNVIKVALNSDPTYQRDIFKAVLYPVAGSFWGRGVPERMKDLQDMCNACARALVYNMAFSAGPQYAIDMTQVPPSESLTQSYPGKLWKFAYRQGETRKPLEFFVVPNVAQQLQAIYDRYEAMADERILPAYSYGNDRAAGAAQTAAGLSMLMAASDVGNKRVVREIDRTVIKPLIKRVWFYNMVYDPDPTIKGDMEVCVRGATGHMLKAQQAAVLANFLSMTGASEIDLNIIGKRRRANALRILASRMGETGEQLVPTDDEMAARDQAEAQAIAAQQAQAQAQAKAQAQASQQAQQPQGVPA